MSKQQQQFWFLTSSSCDRDSFKFSPTFHMVNIRNYEMGKFAQEIQRNFHPGKS